jgi:hypothetical protein
MILTLLEGYIRERWDDGTIGEAVNDERRTTNDERPTTENQEPRTEGRPTMSDEQRITYYAIYNLQSAI